MTGLIRPIGKRKSRFVHPDEARRRLDQIIVPEKPAQERGYDEIMIDEMGETYRLQPRNRNFAFNWTKNLLDDEKEHTIREWNDITKDQEFYVPPTSAYLTTLVMLYDSRMHSDPDKRALVEKMRGMFREDFKTRTMMTGTSILYEGEGPHHLIHRAKDRAFHDTARITQHMPHWDNNNDYFRDFMTEIAFQKDTYSLEKAIEWVCGKRPMLFTLSKAQGAAECDIVLHAKHPFFTIDAKLAQPRGCARGYNQTYTNRKS